MVDVYRPQKSQVLFVRVDAHLECMGVRVSNDDIQEVNSLSRTLNDEAMPLEVFQEAQCSELQGVCSVSGPALFVCNASYNRRKSIRDACHRLCLCIDQ